MRICLLIGGEGTNASAIIKAIQMGELKACCTGVISHNKNANGLKRAQALGVPSVVVDYHDFANKACFEEKLLEQIEQQSPEVIALAGFMRILSAEFLEQLQDKIILNIHPSLLPKYPGLNTHQRVIENQEPYHGATVHLVTAECDMGPVIMQAQIPVSNQETVETLKSRLAPVEHQLYIDALEWVIENPESVMALKRSSPPNTKEASL